MRKLGGRTATYVQTTLVTHRALLFVCIALNVALSAAGNDSLSPTQCHVRTTAAQELSSSDIRCFVDLCYLHKRKLLYWLEPPIWIVDVK